MSRIGGYTHCYSRKRLIPDGGWRCWNQSVSNRFDLSFAPNKIITIGICNVSINWSDDAQYFCKKNSYTFLRSSNGTETFLVLPTPSHRGGASIPFPIWIVYRRVTSGTEFQLASCIVEPSCTWLRPRSNPVFWALYLWIFNAACIHTCFD